MNARADEKMAVEGEEKKVATAAPEASILRGRWELLDALGAGQSETYRARDIESGELCVVKLLDVRLVQEWKAVELFEREVEVLRALKHPRIPALLDAFMEEDADGKTAHLGLVHSYVEGRDLGQALAEGLRLDEARVRAMAEELLDILSYLHGQQPAVIHRDIKPRNIILGEDGRLYLVDFGAVGRFVSPRSGSTVIGSAGYVPVEQLAGRATPASDLYALGATLVFLLARREPIELEFELMRLKFRDVVHISDEFAEFLERLLAPTPEERPADAQAALELLRVPPERLPVRWSGRLKELPREYRAPQASAIAVRQPTPSSLEAVFPRRPSPLWLIPIAGSIIALVHGLVFGAQLGGSVGLAYASVQGLVGLIIFVISLRWALSRVRIELGPQGFRIVRSLGRWERKTELELSDFDGLEMRSTRSDFSHLQVHILRARSNTRPGLNLVRLGIGQAEGQWLTRLFDPAKPADATRALGAPMLERES